MPDFTWRMEGLADLQRQLEDELPKVAKKVVRATVNEGAAWRRLPGSCSAGASWCRTRLF